MAWWLPILSEENCSLVFHLTYPGADTSWCWLRKDISLAIWASVWLLIRSHGTPLLFRYLCSFPIPLLFPPPTSNLYASYKFQSVISHLHNHEDTHPDWKACHALTPKHGWYTNIKQAVADIKKYARTEVLNIKHIVDKAGDVDGQDTKETRK